MTPGRRAVEYRRLRAPVADRSLLVDPPFAEVGPLLAANRSLRADYDYDVHGRSLAELSRQARGELLTAATDYTNEYRSTPAIHGSGPLLLAGHQPELFHPGVWCKNFALAALAREHGGTAVNLLVDSDTMKRASLRAPGGTAARPVALEVPFDQQGPGIPFEERSVRDWSLFESFGRRAGEQIAPLLPDPLIREFWPRVLSRAQATGNMGASFAQARHQLESEWGSTTLELPQSHVCRLPSFLWFCAHLLCELPKLHATYNVAVAEYRHVNRIRSLNHPVPDLAAADGWLEAPFWVWSAQSPRRKRLFVRKQANLLELADRESWSIALPVCGGDLARAVEALARLPAQGIKLRSRALITTLFARLVLGDLFIHGIGGAKYDELTDLIVRRFFEIEPPRYMLLSGTLRLPIAHEPASDAELHDLEGQLRELIYHPERFLGPADRDGAGGREAPALIESKELWIKTPQTKQNAKQRCRAIRRANEGLQPYVADRRKELLAERERLTAALAAQRILASREYAFCLYPEQTLREFLQLVREPAAEQVPATCGRS